ncbi:Amino Acid/Auxin Permease (AAAP) Family [Achlya hypogyna]|uniref:Amino Acid/Auxin Permease (AAAP) Family n=1 Tax=Achlya hypogyna TaxID=1202772 RepID=A0A1V9Z9E7_ACHHY|nr:Amino Acid/Auxin Permease (AAAP) Family [Achlya hypogyna]
MGEDVHSVVILFTYTFGVASLSMGHVFAATGPVVGSILLYLLSAGNLHASALLAKCMALAPSTVQSFGDLGQHACGSFGRYAILISESLSCLLTPIAFLVLGGTQLLPSIASYWGLPHYESTTWIILFALGMLPIIYIPTLKETVVLCVIGSLATFFTDSVGVYVNLNDHPMAFRETAVTARGAVSAYGTIMFAFGTALLIPPLHRQRADSSPDQLVALLSMTMVAITCLYIMIGSATYFQFGCTAPATLLESMPRGLPKATATAAMLVHISVAYPVIMSPTLFVIERHLFGTVGADPDHLPPQVGESGVALLGHNVPASPSDDVDGLHTYKSVDDAPEKAAEAVAKDSGVLSRRDYACRLLLRTGVVAAQCFVAVMLQASFADILTLIGAMTVTLPCMIMPCVCHLRMVQRDGTWLGCFSRAMSIGVIAASAVMGVYSTVEAIRNIQSTAATFHLFQPASHRAFVDGAAQFPYCAVGEQN